MIRLAAFLLIALLAGVQPVVAGPVEDQEIQYLISSVQSLQGVTFLRNGASFDAASAAAHLRVKLRNAGSHVRNAEDFIRLCASTSSMSGKPYELRFSDGRTVTTEAYFRGKLVEYRKSHGPGS